MLTRILFAALAVCIAPNAVAQNKPIYFVVDASGSMDGDNQKDAEDLLRGLSLPRDQLISISYFGSKPKIEGADLCKENIVPPVPTARGADFSPKFPELGGSNDKTAIANAIDSVLRSTNGEAKLVLITDGLEECIAGADYSAIRKRHPNIEIDVVQVGPTPNPALYLLELAPPEADTVISRYQDASTEAQGASPSTAALSTFDAQAVGSDERFYWIFLITLLPLAALQYSLYYNRKVDYANDLNDEARSYSDDQLDRLSGALRADRLAASVTSQVGPNTYGSERGCAVVLSALTVLGGLPLLVSDMPFFVSARRDFWTTINGNFLSDAFAATVLAMTAFATAQWWRWRRARREVMVTIGDVRQSRHIEMHNDLIAARNRLSDLSKAIAGMDLLLTKPRLWQRPLSSATIESFITVKQRLIQLALRNEPFQSQDATGTLVRMRQERAYLADETDRLLKYRGLREASDFAVALGKDSSRLHRHVVDMMERAATLATLGQADKLQECLMTISERLSEILATPTQASSHQ